MTTTELVLNMLAETSVTDISRAEQPETFLENQQVARRGGAIAGAARKAIEAETGKPVITSQNAALGEVMQKLIVDVSEEQEP